MATAMWQVETTATLDRAVSITEIPARQWSMGGRMGLTLDSDHATCLAAHGALVAASVPAEMTRAGGTLAGGDGGEWLRTADDDARVLGVATETARAYRARHDDYPDVQPCPSCGGPVRSRADLEAWARSRPGRTGRPPKQTAT